MEKEFNNIEQDLPTLDIEELEVITDPEVEEDLSFSVCKEDMIPLEPSDSEPEEEMQQTLDEPISSEEEENAAAAPEKPARNWRKSLLVFAHDVLYLLAVLIILSLVLRVVVVSGTSMNDTLKDGDYLLVLSNVFYQNPKQGDIVVASKSTFDDGKPIVKRVIATEGQIVDIDFTTGIVYVDGIALDEPYTKTPTTLQEGVSFPLVVEEGCLFVLGDNRNGSRDSRHPDIGLINKKEIIGKVLFVFLPGTNGEDIFGNPNEKRDFSRIGVPD